MIPSTLGALAQSITADSLLAWMAEPVEPLLRYEDALDWALIMDPRVRFLKTLPLGSTVLDLGAGDGQLRRFREWLAFARTDLAFVGVSLARGAYTDEYEEFFVGDVEATKPSFKRSPTAVVAAQCMEHLRDPQGMINWLAETLGSGGLLHFDWPSPHTEMLPSRRVLLEAGYDVSTINFRDDATHVRAYPIAEMAGMLERANFVLREAGTVRLPYLANQLKHHGIARKDQFLTTLAVWLHCGFISYVVAERR